MIRFTFSDCSAILPALDAQAAARRVFPAVFRAGWSQPGFFILALPADTDSKTQRRFMVDLKEALSGLYQRQTGEPLAYLSLGRFDQQTTTKLHLDGAPELSFLMLGYEATTVRSELHIADYTRCAQSLGITPAGFLRDYNPMLAAGREALAAHTLTLRDWLEDRPRVVLINNSHTAPGHPNHSPGVLHGATITSPDPAARRIINSTMTAPASYAAEDPAAKQSEFLATDQIAGLIEA